MVSGETGPVARWRWAVAAILLLIGGGLHGYAWWRDRAVEQTNRTPAQAAVAAAMAATEAADAGVEERSTAVGEAAPGGGPPAPAPAPAPRPSTSPIRDKTRHDPSPRVIPALVDVDWCNDQLAAALASLPDAGADETLSPYFFVFDDDPDVDALPLKRTDVTVDIAGVVASVALTQVYRNEGERVVEAMYLFPTSSRAAIHALRMTVGGRVIEAHVAEREDARAEYEQALADGRTASLLEQLRPNVFQMLVGNVLPGDEVIVELRYAERIDPRDGEYEFVFPTVVGPRYSNIPRGAATETEAWVERPYLHEGQASPSSTGIELAIDSAVPLVRVESPSHPLELRHHGRRRVEATVEPSPDVGTRDFVVRYALAGAAIESGLLVAPDDDGEGGTFLLLVEPPARTAPAQVAPRELLFVLDVSGSMSGYPLDITKQMMRELLASLRPQDRFDVLLFAGGNAVLSETPLPATETNVDAALRLVDTSQGGGGTELLPALERALALPQTPGASRSVVVATDGYVTVEREAFALIRERLGEANLFAFGTGTSVNRYLIDGLARAGRGEPFVALDPDEGAAQAERFVEYVSAPLLTGIDVAVDGGAIEALEPAELPDLFARRPLTLTGRYAGPAGAPRGRVVLTAHGADGPYREAFALADAAVASGHGALRQLWARDRIAALSDHGPAEPDAEIVAEVTALGLEHGLMTEYTSFVAVDTVARADEPPLAIEQALPLPAGVSDLAVGGGELASGPGGAAVVTPADAPPAFGASIGGPPRSCRALAREDGLGAGGTAMGLGGLGTAGYGTGASGYGHGGGTFGAKASGSPGMVSASPIILGAVDRTSIERVIRNHLNQIRYCYQRELQKDPDLAGKIVIRFTIAADGSVAMAEVKSSTLDNPVLDACVRKRFLRMRFQPPAGGGVVVVSYPIVFSAADE